MRKKKKSGSNSNRIKGIINNGIKEIPSSERAIIIPIIHINLDTQLLTKRRINPDALGFEDKDLRVIKRAQCAKNQNNKTIQKNLINCNKERGPF